LAWRNYGNGHTIFDASASLSPDGTSVNNTNSQVAWTGTYPTLMGWNGANTYGVRVDSARLADALSTVVGSAPSYAARAWVNFDGTSNSANLSGTYSRTSPSTTVFVTATSHGLITGNRVFLDFTTGTALDGNYEVTVTSANTFTVTTVASTSTGGNVTLRRNPIRGSGNVSSISDDNTGDYTVNFATAMPDTNFGWTTGSVNAAIVTGATATVKTTASIQFVTVRSSTGATQDSAEFCVAIFR
jgi:hypothetical protein